MSTATRNTVLAWTLYDLRSLRLKLDAAAKAETNADRRATRDTLADAVRNIYTSVLAWRPEGREYDDSRTVREYLDANVDTTREPLTEAEKAHHYTGNRVNAAASALETLPNRWLQLILNLRRRRN